MVLHQADAFDARLHMGRFNEMYATLVVLVESAVNDGSVVFDRYHVSQFT